MQMIPKIHASTLLVIIPVLYFNSCTIGFITDNPIVKPIVILLWAAWLLMSILEDKEFDQNAGKCLLLMGAWLTILFLFSIFGMGIRITSLSVAMNNVLFIIIFMVFFVKYSKPKYYNDRQIIVQCWTVDTLVSSIYSIYKLEESPYLSRYLSTGSFHLSEAAKEAKGVISFGGVYGLVMVLTALFFLYINNKEKRTGRAILIICFLIFVFKAQFTMAIIFLMFGIVCVVFNRLPSKKRKAIILAALCLVPLFVFVPDVLSAIAKSSFFGDAVSQRLNELSQLLTGDLIVTQNTDIILRLEKYTQSIDSIKHSYGLGAIFDSSATSGGHSELLDGFASYGIIYVLFVIATVSFYRYVVTQMRSSKAKRIYKIVFGVFILISTFNTSTWAPMMQVLFVIIPFLCMNECDEERVRGGKIENIVT